MRQLDLVTSKGAAYTAPSGAPLVTITAYGTPAPQGAISYNGVGRGYYSNDKTLRPWRAAVRDAAMEVLGTHEHEPPTRERKGRSGPCAACGIPRRDHGHLRGAYVVLMTVTLPPLANPRALPVTRSSGDWDHHGRAIGDALTQASVWADDSQVVDGRVRKFYPGHPLALDRPGAVIQIWRVS